ncbi:zinc finger protein 628-like isoform X1 [Salvelinus fontinalis]|uniref:zinc finger protein 628-like isoform X1 n=2 Tax=Salvelinus fontinalis TaxID=8038 RepID=UPI00248551D8|nr:zinc finger protein 628-like isoform X1 [Salvelinus fontinalis]
MMSAAIITFQSQLSGVMETVLKSAMYEITRLVEDSFLEEVSRSREQVESLKTRLQWSENREGGQRGKCGDCGRAGKEGEEISLGTSQTGVERGRGLKQEKVQGEEWSSCGGVAGETTFNDLEEAEATSPKRTSEVGRGLTKHMEAEATSPKRTSEVGRGLTKHMEAEATSPKRTSEVGRGLTKHMEAEATSPKRTSEVGRGLTKHMEAEATSPKRTSESTEVTGQKLDSLLKEEALHNTELQERWEFCLDEADGLDVSGPSKSFIQQELQQCQDEWGSSLDQRPEPPGPEGDQRKPIDPLYRPHYSMEELGGDFEKSGYDSLSSGGHLIDMEGLDRLPGSPSRLGALSYGAVGHYQVNLGGSEGGDHHHRSHMPGSHQRRREQVESPTPPPHPVVGDLNCLLINEEGYLQDSSVLYPEHGVPESGNRAGHRGLTSIHSGSSAHNNTESPDDAADDFGHSLNLRDCSQEQVTGGGGRRHACTQCTMSFPDSGSLKSHKQTHKTGRGLSSASGPPYSCTQCGKTFTQACNLKVHQRVHQAEGLHLCSHCSKGFTSFSDLKRHKCSQTTDKPYCCSICGNKFSRLWNLKLHQRIHTQEKPHRCTMCDKSFTRVDILKVHQRTHTGERPYCCAVCGLSFKRLAHLKLHQHKHRPNFLA